MVFAQSRICPGKWDTHTPQGYWDTNRLPNLIRMTGLYGNHQQKPCWILDTTLPADHRVKLKDSENKENYMNLARELKKTEEHESDGCTNYNLWSWYSYQRIVIRISRLRNKKWSKDNQN